MNPSGTTRRSVLAGGLAGLALAVSEVELLAAMLQAGAAERSGPGPGLFSADDRADLDAITAQIVPTDSTPGAREAGAVNFIERALNSFLAPVAADFHTGLTEFQQGVRTQYPGTVSFAALPATSQIEWLHAVEHTAFFGLVRLLTVLGMFSSPSYGGNRDEAGWRLMGFTDQHAFAPPFGYYDRDYPGFAAQQSGSK